MPVVVPNEVARFRLLLMRFRILRQLLGLLSAVLFTLSGSTSSATPCQIVCLHPLRP